MSGQDSRNIFIHIGPHKTGTTTIQIGLINNLAQLKANGYWVPKTGLTPPYFAAHNNLSYELFDPDRWEEKYGSWADLIGELNSIPGPMSVILSGEAFSFLGIDEISKIKKYLAPHQVIMVIYLRRQDQWLQSIWQQRIKTPDQNKPVPFTEFVDQFKDNEPQYDYYPIITAWAGVLGDENIRVRLLEDTPLRGGLFLDFLTTCGIKDPHEYSAPVNMNESPGAQTLEVLYFVKKTLAGQTSQKHLKALFSFIVERAEEWGWNKTRLELVDQPLYEQIMSCYEAENQKIARRYLDREHLFLQPFKADPKTHFNTDHLDNDVLYRLLHTYPFRLYSRRSRIIHAGQTNDTNSVNVLLEKVFIRVCSMRFWRIMHLITEMRIRAGKFWGVDHGGRIGQ